MILINPPIILLSQTPLLFPIIHPHPFIFFPMHFLPLGVDFISLSSDVTSTGQNGAKTWIVLAQLDNWTFYHPHEKNNLCISLISQSMGDLWRNPKLSSVPGGETSQSIDAWEITFILCHWVFVVVGYIIVPIANWYTCTELGAKLHREEFVCPRLPT